MGGLGVIPMDGDPIKSAAVGTDQPAIGTDQPVQSGEWTPVAFTAPLTEVDPPPTGRWLDDAYVRCGIYAAIAGLTAIQGDMAKDQVTSSTFVVGLTAALIAAKAFISNPNGGQNAAKKV